MIQTAHKASLVNVWVKLMKTCPRMLATSIRSVLKRAK